MGAGEDIKTVGVRELPRYVGAKCVTLNTEDRLHIWLYVLLHAATSMALVAFMPLVTSMPLCTWIHLTHAYAALYMDTQAQVGWRICVCAISGVAEIRRTHHGTGIHETHACI